MLPYYLPVKYYLYCRTILCICVLSTINVSCMTRESTKTPFVSIKPIYICSNYTHDRPIKQYIQDWHQPVIAFMKLAMLKETPIWIHLGVIPTTTGCPTHKSYNTGPPTVTLVRSLYRTRVVQRWKHNIVYSSNKATKIAKFMGPTWCPPGSCRPQIGPMLAHEPCFQGSCTKKTCKNRGR